LVGVDKLVREVLLRRILPHLDSCSANYSRVAGAWLRLHPEELPEQDPGGGGGRTTFSPLSSPWFTSWSLRRSLRSACDPSASIRPEPWWVLTGRLETICKGVGFSKGSSFYVMFKWIITSFFLKRAGSTPAGKHTTST
jgi:hypothetical protein